MSYKRVIIADPKDMEHIWKEVKEITLVKSEENGGWDIYDVIGRNHRVYCGTISPYPDEKKVFIDLINRYLQFHGRYIK